MDIKMPVMNGIKASQIIRKLQAGYLYFTAYRIQPEGIGEGCP